MADNKVPPGPCVACHSARPSGPKENPNQTREEKRMLGVRAEIKQTKLTNACRGKLVLTRAICC